MAIPDQPQPDIQRVAVSLGKRNAAPLLPLDVDQWTTLSCALCGPCCRLAREVGRRRNLYAIAAATRLYNVSDLARKSGLARQSIYRAFAADPRKPKFTTVLDILDAMGFQLHVTMRRDAPARAAPSKPIGNRGRAKS
jgi:probable addiction module antidote protein